MRFRTIGSSLLPGTSIVLGGGLKGGYSQSQPSPLCDLLYSVDRQLQEKNSTLSLMKSTARTERTDAVSS